MKRKKYKNEREAMERAYQRELEDRRRQFVDKRIFYIKIIQNFIKSTATI